MKPKYIIVYEDIRDKIFSSKFMVGSYLPSEMELMSIYDSSRDTIRKSLNLLLNNGLIQKNKGKGSLVLDRSKIAFPISGLTSFKELSVSLGEDIKTIVNKFEVVEADNFSKDTLYIEEGNYYSIERIRRINKEKIILDIDYINEEIVPGLTKKIVEKSIYKYIEKDLGLKIGFANKEITVLKASDHEKKLLDMDGYDLLVCVKSFVYLEDARLFQYTISKHRPDKFRFVDFARRNKI